MNQQQNGMNGGGFSFDLNQVESSSFGVVPAGTYRVQVEKAELVDNQNTPGKGIKTTFVITDENQNGRKLFERYNVMNQNQKAVEIAQQQIKDLVQASGGSIGIFSHESQLIGLECLAVVKVYNDGEYGEKNKISYFKPLPMDLPQGADVGGNPPF